MHWLWRAVGDYGRVFAVLLQPHGDTEAVKSFSARLRSEPGVPVIIHTNKLRSDGAVLRELPVPRTVKHVQGISTARCNTLIEQSHRATP
ncbi:DDE-type integrase/transposase/recombinase [Deinococcus oregonensis]|uniref:DDE-type integrase/transposase/recombinase n=1 Tax=Deinococcus oregonensis TaxID=1805970 RepID=A0ABV6AV80_9DEIO